MYKKTTKNNNSNHTSEKLLHKFKNSPNIIFGSDLAFVFLPSVI